MAVLRKIWAWIREFHDRLIAVSVLVALSIALLRLAAGLVANRATYEAYKSEVEAMKPRYPSQEVVKVQEYDAAVARLEKPFLLGAWSNGVFNPEKRVRCVDCMKPIPYDALKCTFCLADVPPDPSPYNPDEDDLDKDGIKDVWERKYGLDPTNPRDAVADPDDDGATNLEEFRASTDPKDAVSSPELVATKLVVQKIVPEPFPLLFMTVNTNFSGGTRFTITTLDYQKMFTVKMGEKVLGYSVVGFEPKQIQKPMGVLTQVVDVSVLTLKRGDKEIFLVKGQSVQVESYRAELLLLSDGSVREVLVDGTFELKGKKYTVIAIDIKGHFVVLKRDNDGQEFKIGKVPTDGRADPAGKTDVGSEVAR